MHSSIALLNKRRQISCSVHILCCRRADTQSHQNEKAKIRNKRAQTKHISRERRKEKTRKREEKNSKTRKCAAVSVTVESHV